MKPARPQSARSRSLAIDMRAVGAVALAVTLASCTLFGGGGGNGSSAPASGAAGQADPSIVAAAPAELRSYYSQQVDWKPCEGSFQCAKIKVPLDYSKPDGDRIELAARTHLALIESHGGRRQASNRHLPIGRLCGRK